MLPRAPLWAAARPPHASLDTRGHQPPRYAQALAATGPSILDLVQVGGLFIDKSCPCLQYNRRQIILHCYSWDAWICRFIEPLSPSHSPVAMHASCQLPAPQAYSRFLPFASFPFNLSSCLANTCKSPNATYVCTGGATDSTVGACSAIACTAGYSGSPSTPLCSVQDGTWTFTGTCIGEWGRT